jgi:methylglyoxal synthase
MKLEVKNKSLLPANLYATGTVAAIIELAKYYNGKPIESTPVRGDLSSAKSEGNEGGFVMTKATKIFLFYRAYTK